MLDGTTIDWRIENFEIWRRSVNIPFSTSVDIFETGEIKSKKRNDEIITTHRAKWETFDLIVKEVYNAITENRKYYLKIRGSFHKNYYRGKNYLPFTFEQLQEQISHICKSLCINPTEAKISTLEIGVNIVTPFVVTPFIMQNLVNYKGKYFTRYPENLGVTCRGTQYEVKIYDKGKQNELPQNLMRFELKFFKMQKLKNRGISYLSDLLTFANIKGLLYLLLEAWQSVLIYDLPETIGKFSVKYGTIRNNTELNRNKIDLLNKGKRFQYWEELKPLVGRSTYYNKLNTFKNLVGKYGNNSQQTVNDLIKIEWEELFKKWTNLPTGKSPYLSGTENIEKEKMDKFTIKINGNNVHSYTDYKKYFKVFLKTE